MQQNDSANLSMEKPGICLFIREKIRLSLGAAIIKDYVLEWL
jgi:hypothetical protein